MSSYVSDISLLSSLRYKTRSYHFVLFKLISHLSHFPSELLIYSGDWLWRFSSSKLPQGVTVENRCQPSSRTPFHLGWWGNMQLAKEATVSKGLEGREVSWDSLHSHSPKSPYFQIFPLGLRRLVQNRFSRVSSHLSSLMVSPAEKALMSFFASWYITLVY